MMSRAASLVDATAARMRIRRALFGVAIGAGLAAAFVASGALAAWVGPEHAALGLSADASRSLIIVAALVVGAAAAVAAAIAARHRVDRVAAALAVEAAVPTSRNLVLTAVESPAAGSVGALRDYVAGEVARRADLAVAGTLPGAIVPLTRASLLAATSVLAAIVMAARAGRVEATVVAGSGDARILAIQVTTAPPAYTGRAQATSRDPARIEVIEGSRIEFAVSVSGGATGDSVRIVHGGDTTRLPIAQATARGAVTADRPGDGAVMIQYRDAAAFVALTVAPDAPPRVTIEAPGRDLIVADGARTLPVRIRATDDIGLASLTLRYTRVRGSGERFSFDDGELPLTVQAEDAATWRGDVRWALGALNLEPGDMVVYRAVAADTRPNAPPVESDAAIIEVAAPGGIALGGFALDPDEDRYALSQQMIVQKTERLIARRATVSADSAAAEAANIAAEQRRVRAEFVFMLGGEMTEVLTDTSSMTDLDEQAHAEADEDLLAGRDVNSGRQALTRAIRAMSRAARALDDGDLAAALPMERAAVVEIERAFARGRIILRALGDREALDPARRLTGDLSDATRALRDSRRPDAESDRNAAIQLLRDISRANAAPNVAEPSPAALLGWSARALQIKALGAARNAIGAALVESARAQPRERRQWLDSATVRLSAALAAGRAGTGRFRTDPRSAELRGAVTDRWRGRGR
ncbi:MAG: hypothetical protein FJ202_08650 [Gemmatimonadetes bacterium]|nr:hypothetical protein [Gemmatimonadota bacterium]